MITPPKPPNTEPIITLSYNHQQFEAMVYLLQDTVDHLENGLESGVSTEYIKIRRALLSTYQTILKDLLDAYDVKHKGARHYTGQYQSEQLSEEQLYDNSN